MDATKVYALLQAACRMLEANGDHATSAYVGQAMAMVKARHGVGRDHLTVDGDD